MEGNPPEDDQFADAEPEDGVCLKFESHSTKMMSPQEVEVGVLENVSGMSITRGDFTVDDEDEEDDDSEEEFWAWEGETSDFTKRFNAARSQYPQPNSNNPNSQRKGGSHYQPQSLSRFANKITVEKYSGPQRLPHSATNLLMQNNKRADSDRVRVKDKADRATMEQVLDPRTRMILFKMLNKKAISEINGCISTGKEANVYHATTPQGEHRAIKVYKTSILTFKDRDKYVSGEYRFRHGYCRHNPRKMVRTWAEKEMRNLIRLHSVGISCPEPILLRSHVLLMEFIGSDGWPAPLLKDVTLSESKARELYVECIQAVRQIYQEAKLVHADLSEFNMLFCNDKLYIIDVSQSVEHDHPHALEFLRKDCTNVTEYFRKNGVCTMTVRELFDFVTDPNINSSNMDDYLEQAMERVAQRSQSEITEQEKIDEEVFKNTFIPRRLEEVMHIEAAIKKAKEGDADKEIYYKNITGLATEPSQAPIIQQEDDTKGNDEEGVKRRISASSEGEDENSEEEEEGDSQKYNRPRDESPNARRERKKAVKEEQRENRKNKIPKHVKKRKEKIAKVNRGTRK
ncbi:serine/threonine-protein kinase RIO1-like [Amphiura filiformis]|uniref:serine/threonine-protein kinase RIO1-like n=1 Tax=Amphiura filiformis TaxID=82378 RepID=UPI003B20BC6C